MLADQRWDRVLPNVIGCHLVGFLVGVIGDNSYKWEGQVSVHIEDGLEIAYCDFA